VPQERISPALSEYSEAQTFRTELLRLLQRNPEMLTPALEESLRYESPVARQPRLMKADTVFGGREIRRARWFSRC